VLSAVKVNLLDVNADNDWFVFGGVTEEPDDYEDSSDGQEFVSQTLLVFRSVKDGSFVKTRVIDGDVQHGLIMCDNSNVLTMSVMLRDTDGDEEYKQLRIDVDEDDGCKFVRALIALHHSRRRGFNVRECHRWKSCMQILLLKLTNTLNVLIVACTQSHCQTLSLFLIASTTANDYAQSDVDYSAFTFKDGNSNGSSVTCTFDGWFSAHDCSEFSYGAGGDLKIAATTGRKFTEQLDSEGSYSYCGFGFFDSGTYLLCVRDDGELHIRVTDTSDNER
jgi:hypothetical protein